MKIRNKILKTCENHEIHFADKQKHNFKTKG